MYTYVYISKKNYEFKNRVSLSPPSGKSDQRHREKTVLSQQKPSKE